MNTIKELVMNLCKICDKELHYPCQLHTVFDGYKCCKCLGHEYSDCFNPWQREKITYEQYKEPERIEPEKECTEGCLTYSTYCEYNHN